MPKISCSAVQQYFGYKIGETEMKSKAFPLHPGWTAASFPQDHTPQAYAVPAALCQVSAYVLDLSF